MSDGYFIDGVGDEVTITLGILLAIFVVIVSWLSTRVNDTNFATDDILRTTRLTVSVANRQTQQQSNQGSTENTTEQVHEHPANDVAQSNSDSSAGETSNQETSSESTVRQRNVQSSQSSESSTSQQNESSTQDNGTAITIRLKFMDETVQTVQARSTDTLEHFRRQNLPVENRDRYRLIYRGQVLRDGSRTLQQLNLDCTITDPSAIPVIHCFLSPATATENGNLASSASQQMQMVAEELQIGSLLLPILGIGLLFMWYLCIFHTSLFSIQSVVSIVGFSFLYIALVVNQIL